MADSITSEPLIAAARQLSCAVGGMKFQAPVTHVYNPLQYAWAVHQEYLRRFGNSRKRVVFLGMNPGPFGMVQTGIPFGEVAAVRDWMQLPAQVGKPAIEHPKRPITGFDCKRSEVSGKRLWKLFADRFGSPEAFFADHFVVNYCPLAFCETSGCNRTPDKLPATESAKLFRACDEHLQQVVEILKPEWLIGVGAFARERAETVCGAMPVKIGQILHPSPASPLANRDWPGTVARQLRELGVWQ
ncbi:MAG: single-stranded DNA-binding protein [Verrucomicrobia bacterium]|nr:single-stranded DNA-binding protein [Verrucomicrobiota bacterium]